MPEVIARERLLGLLRRRHQLAVIALQAPAGFGRTVLLRQALDEGPVRPVDRDVAYTCVRDDASIGHLTASLLQACEAAGAQVGRRPDDAAGAARAVAGSLGALVSTGGHVALVVDDIDTCGPDGAGFWAALVDHLPAGVHLVASGRRLPPIGLARLVASGTAVLVDAAALAFSPDEVPPVSGSAEPLAGDREVMAWPALASLVAQGRADLIGDYLLENVLEGLDVHVTRALAAVAAVDGCPTEMLPAVIGTTIGAADLPPTDVTTDDLVAQLGRLPLVRTGDGCWPHPTWAAATSAVLGPDDVHRATSAKVAGQVHSGALHDAASTALRTRNGEALALVVRAALGAHPPKASMADLRRWAASGILPAGAVERGWLEAVVHPRPGGTDGAGRLERVRRDCADADDIDAEAKVLLRLGALARERSDTGEMARLLGRAQVLAAQGNDVAIGLVALGQAVSAQMVGDHEGAVRILDHAPCDALAGDWAAQVLMVRGTNLLLAGRLGAAVAALDAATGEGSEASRAVAHDLLSTARWYAGDPIGALDDGRSADVLATRSHAASIVPLVRANRACMLAATGQRADARDALARLHAGTGTGTTDEAAALTRLAEVLVHADAGDLDSARSILAATTVVGRPVRSSTWKTALDHALEPPGGQPRDVAVGAGPALERAVAAGRAAARHLAGGPPADGRHRPYLPARWCAPSRGSLVVRLNGAARIERDFRAVDHPAWGRARVRELCLHLALVTDRSRSGVAAALWPDRDDRSARHNLRVTLTYLLDVLDPDRVEDGGPPLLVEHDGLLTLNRDGDLHVDLWDLRRHADAVMAASDHERPSMLSHARRMLLTGPGPMLSDVASGEWVEPHQRRLDDVVHNAALRAGRHAVEAADHELAEALGQRALAVDPWSEQAHGLVIEARLHAGDRAGARRALLHALAVFADLGVDPDRATSALASRVGLAASTTG